MSTSTTTHPTLMPAVDVYQGPDDVRLVADLPGASAEAVHVAVEGRVLSLEAATTAGTAGPITYRRKFNLGPELDPTGVRAEVST